LPFARPRNLTLTLTFAFSLGSFVQEPIAWMKMEELGLIEYFDVPLFGGFGNLFCSGELDVNESGYSYN